MKFRSIPCAFTGTALALSFTLSNVAWANDPAAAQSLFNEGKRLANAGQLAAACSKFEESQRLDPGIGTLFHVANCYEREGKTASAWAAFLEVAGEAKTKGQTARAAVAQERANALEKRIPKLVIVAHAVENVPGISIQRDGTEVGRGQWGSSVPIDPGSHTIVVTAPGKRRWESTTTAPATDQAIRIDVPALVDAPVATAPTSVAPPVVASKVSPQETAPIRTTDTMATVPTPVESRPTTGNTQRAFGLGLAGLGLVGLGVGAFYGLKSKDDGDTSRSHCVDNRCDLTGKGLRDDAIENGTISTIAIAAGAGLVVGGAVLYFTAPRQIESTTTAKKVRVTPIVGQTMGLSLGGGF